MKIEGDRNVPPVRFGRIAPGDLFCLYGGDSFYIKSNRSEAPGTLAIKVRTGAIIPMGDSTLVHPYPNARVVLGDYEG